jgi:hypothetical protein
MFEKMVVGDVNSAPLTLWEHALWIGMKYGGELEVCSILPQLRREFSLMFPSLAAHTFNSKYKSLVALHNRGRTEGALKA